MYSGNPLNGHLSTADTHDIMDNSESPDCLFIYFKQPLNSRHPTIPYNGQLLRSQLYEKNTQRLRFSRHSSTFSAKLSTITAVVNILTVN